MLKLKEWYSKLKTCSDCGKPISNASTGRCRLCCQKGELNPMFGVRMEKHHNWQGGLTKKQYHCKKCGKNILHRTALYGSFLCVSCSRIGQKRSQEVKDMMREQRLGIGNPNWKGGLTTIYHIIRSSRDGKIWRKMVVIRDKYTCQKCFKKPETVYAHHIKSFLNHPEHRFDINNGITLCKECHDEVHNKKTR